MRGGGARPLPLLPGAGVEGLGSAASRHPRSWQGWPGRETRWTPGELSSSAESLSIPLAHRGCISRIPAHRGCGGGWCRLPWTPAKVKSEWPFCGTPVYLVNLLISQVEKPRFRIHGHHRVSNQLALASRSCGPFKKLIGIWEGNYAVDKVF